MRENRLSLQAINLNLNFEGKRMGSLIDQDQIYSRKLTAMEMILFRFSLTACTARFFLKNLLDFFLPMNHKSQNIYKLD